MGALFAEVIAEKRTKVAKGRGTQGAERIGSLLTRMFLDLGVDLDTSTCNVEKEFLDTNFLINCKILHDATTYRFTSKDRRFLFCRLPQLSLTDLEVATNVEFTPGIEYLCSITRATARSTPAHWRSTLSSHPAPDVHLSAEEIEDLEAHTGSEVKG